MCESHSVRYDLVEGDIEQPIAMTLNSGPNPPPIPDGTTVRFTMAQADGTKRVSALGVITDPVLWQVHYQWVVGDTSVPGVYRAQWTLIYPGGAPETFPSDEPLFVVVSPLL